MAIKKQTYYGSGTVYEMVYNSATVTIPTTTADLKTFVEANATTANQIGFLKNGFQVAVTTENLEDQSDLGEMKVSLITSESGTMTFALFNSNGETLSRLYPTAKTTVDGKTTVVGGLGNAAQNDHVIIFVSAQKNEDGERTCFVAVGKNNSGFNINWNPSSVEPFSCEYTIVPFGTDGEMFTIGDVATAENYPIQ